MKPAPFVREVRVERRGAGSNLHFAAFLDVEGIEVSSRNLGRCKNTPPPEVLAAEWASTVTDDDIAESLQAEVDHQESRRVAAAMAVRAARNALKAAGR